MDEQNPIVSLVCGDLSKKTQMTCDLIVSFIEKRYHYSIDSVSLEDLIFML